MSAELMQTEMHHIRTLRIMSEVFSKGLQKEVQLELQTVEKMFPALDDLLELHSQHLQRLLERKKETQLEEGSFIISRIGDILINQVRAGRHWCGLEYRFWFFLDDIINVAVACRCCKTLKLDKKQYNSISILTSVIFCCSSRDPTVKL